MLREYSVSGIFFLVLGIGIFSLFLSRVMRKDGGPMWLRAIMIVAIIAFAAFFVVENAIEIMTPLMPDPEAGFTFPLKFHGRDHYVSVGMLLADKIAMGLFIGTWAAAFVGNVVNELRKKRAQP